MQNEGWKCPGCGKCYAPSVVQCYTCGITETKVPVRSGTECYHIWGQPMIHGTFCIDCGMQRLEWKWEKTGNTWKGSYNG